MIPSPETLNTAVIALAVALALLAIAGAWGYAHLANALDKLRDEQHASNKFTDGQYDRLLERVMATEEEQRSRRMRIAKAALRILPRVAKKSGPGDGGGQSA